MEIQTWDQLFGSTDNQISNLSIRGTYPANRSEIAAAFGDGDISAKKIDFSTLNIQLLDKAITQDITTNGTDTDIASAILTVNVTRTTLAIFLGSVQFSIQQGASGGFIGTARVSLNIDGATRSGYITDTGGNGGTTSEGAGDATTRSLHDVLFLKPGKHIIKLKALNTFGSGTPKLHITSFRLTYIPFGG